jgi:site-specific DNA-methyltransferase (adenine-specific)
MIAPNSIINGDCLEVMKDIDDHSIDCIICDLPYGITACKWDLVIPFDRLWEQYKRIIKPNGAICLFGSQPFTSALVMSNPKWFKYEWIWEKNYGSNFASVKYQPFKAHENIVIFGNGRVNYYPTKERCADSSLKRDKLGSKRFKNDYTEAVKHTGMKSSSRTIIQDGKRYPFSYQRFNRDDLLNKEISHPTRKPVALIEYLIKTYTQEGELILDNTAGSGTLAIAAINTNRNYICIEKDPHYFEVMRNRIENHDPFAPVKTKKPKAAPKGQLTLFDGGLAV